MTEKTFDYRGYYLIIITEVHPTNQQNIILNVLRDCWSLYIANVYILTIPNRSPEVTMYTFFPFTENHCDHVDPVIVNNGNGTDFNSSLEIFVDKFENMHKCNIIATVSDYRPYTIITPSSNGTYTLDGIEGLLIHELKRTMNFTLILKNISPNTGYGATMLEMVCIKYAVFYTYVLLN